MQSLRRKSMTSLQPSMPTLALSQQNGRRTDHQEMPHPKDQLKYLRRKMLTPQIEDVHAQPLKKTMSLTPQKFSTAATLHTEDDPRDKINSPSVPDFNELQGETPPQNQDELEGYEIGDAADEANSQSETLNKLDPSKKCFTKPSQRALNPEMSTAEARMEDRVKAIIQKDLQLARQKGEFIGLQARYQMNKNKLLKQSNRRVQSYRLLASLKRAGSLPHLEPIHPPTHVLVVPSYKQIKDEEDSEKRKKRLAQKLLEGSLSKKMCCHHKKDSSQNQLQNQLETVRAIEDKLRQKGVSFNAGALKKGLVNIRNVPIFIRDDQIFETKALLSNQIKKTRPY